VILSNIEKSIQRFFFCLLKDAFKIHLAQNPFALACILYFFKEKSLFNNE